MFVLEIIFQLLEIVLCKLNTISYLFCVLKLLLFFLWYSGEGVEFQTHLSEETTNKLLEKLKPVLIFTGHDHDGCIYKHNDQTTE
jgi:hypothetical protein